MKSHYLFCFVLSFITCSIFTWKAESPINETLGFIAVVVSIIGIGKMIVNKLNGQP
ncbi:MAG: hypothetical protein JWP81_4514 [Ferruginibacter sp.]|nr:hypothetical protein [Ferruginibacter sp.]